MGGMKFTKFEIFLEQLRLGGAGVLGKHQDKVGQAMANVDFANIRDSGIHKKDQKGKRYSELRESSKESSTERGGRTVITFVDGAKGGTG